jgi:protein-disulfide isomerase
MQENRSKFVSLLSNNLIILFFILFSSGLSFLVGNLWTRVKYAEGGAGTELSGVRNAAEAGSENYAPPEDPIEQIRQVVADLKIDEGKFESCMNNGEFKNKVTEQMTKGEAAGVRGTPGNFVVNLKTGEVVMLRGAEPLSNLQAVTDYLLKKSTTLPDGLTASKGIEALPLPDDKDHLDGKKDATIALIEYSDFDCPFCKAFHTTAQQFMKDNSDAQWIYRHYPIVSLHPNASYKAEASECIAKLGGEGAFWQFADAMAQIN